MHFLPVIAKQVGQNTVSQWAVSYTHLDVYKRQANMLPAVVLAVLAAYVPWGF